MKNMIGHEGPKLQMMFLLQRGRCAICGQIMHPARGSAQHKNGWTQEHVEPQSNGGGREANIVLTHSHCNNQKGNQAPKPYMKRMAKDLNQIFHLMTNSRTRLNQRQKQILHGGDD